MFEFLIHVFGSLVTAVFILFFWILFLEYKYSGEKPTRIALRTVFADYIITMEPHEMKRISSLVTQFIVTALALTYAGASAAIDGAISIVSSDPNVLLVTPVGDGQFLVKVVGKGLATLTVSGDADLGDGIRSITQSFEFEVYDGDTEADHFDLTITDILRSDEPSADAANENATDSSAAATS
ncbi:hypothetical protein [Methylomonas sp. ZR1]|uniref:hypothetical protein n=1 Tax=Methylomonas sp. ZR1 TaxID=1797072 RepID=UPI0014917B14|nr:hypothetical protein [Methylomonas sp. ZR1]NOV29181.1 hypothetical protein [Methylomonas sp. ZR1]